MLQSRVQELIHQGALTAAAHAGDAHQPPQGEVDVEAGEVVARATHQGELARAAAAALRRGGDRLSGFAEWWVSTAVRSVMAARLSIWRKSSSGDCSWRSPLGSTDGLPLAEPGRLAGEPQTGAPALARGRAPTSNSPEAEAGQACGRLGAASPGIAPTPGLGHGLPVRRHRRWPAALVPQRDRRAQPPLPGPPGG